MQFSERQQKTITAAITVAAAIVLIAAVLGLGWVLAHFVQRFSNVLLPVAVAGILALVFQPYYDWLRARMPVYVSIAALFLSVIVPLGAFVVFFGSVVVHELGDMLEQLPNWWSNVEDKIEQKLPEFNIKEYLAENPLGQKIAQTLQGLGPNMVAALEYVAGTSVHATSSLVGWIGGLVSWAVLPVYFVFILLMKRKDVAQLADHLPFLKAETRGDVVFLVHEFVNIMVAFFRGQIVIAFLQGVLLAIGFTIVGLKYGFVLGFVLGFLNVIPYLGSMVGLGITLPLSYFQEDGGLPTLIGVIIVLSIVQLVEGYVLTPKIMGERTGLHPMAIIIAVFFWGSALGGILGMILAIPLTAFLVVFWRLAKEKYIAEIM